MEILWNAYGTFYLSVPLRSHNAFLNLSVRHNAVQIKVLSQRVVMGQNAPLA